MNHDRDHDQDLERLISRSLASRSDVIDGATGSIDDVHRRVDLRRGRRRHAAAFGATAMLAAGAFAMTAIGSSDPTTVPLAPPDSHAGSQPDVQEVWRCTGPVAPTDDEGVSYFDHCEHTTIDGSVPTSTWPLITTTTIACPATSTDTATSTVPCTWGPTHTATTDLAPTDLVPTTTLVATTTSITGHVFGEQEYVIQAGDSLHSIAAAFGVTLEQLVNYNQFDDGIDHVLLPGERLLVPPGALAQP